MAWCKTHLKISCICLWRNFLLKGCSQSLSLKIIMIRQFGNGLQCIHCVTFSPILNPIIPLFTESSISVHSVWNIVIQSNNYCLMLCMFSGQHMPCLLLQDYPKILMFLLSLKWLRYCTFEQLFYYVELVHMWHDLASELSPCAMI